MVERVRILCTVYDPETGEYRYDYGLIFEIIGGLTFFISVAASTCCSSRLCADRAAARPLPMSQTA